MPYNCIITCNENFVTRHFGVAFDITDNVRYFRLVTRIGLAVYFTFTTSVSYDLTKTLYSSVIVPSVKVESANASGHFWRLQYFRRIDRKIHCMHNLYITCVCDVYMLLYHICYLVNFDHFVRCSFPIHRPLDIEGRAKPLIFYTVGNSEHMTPSPIS